MSHLQVGLQVDNGATSQVHIQHKPKGLEQLVITHKMSQMTCDVTLLQVIWVITVCGKVCYKSAGQDVSCETFWK